MGVETAADRAVFVNPANFGVVASYTPAGGSSASEINVIFDSGYFAVGLDAVVPIESGQLRAVARTADLPNVSHGATLVIAGVTYKVRGNQPDGTGMTTLVLEQQ
jgi:hypothetical protein